MIVNIEVVGEKNIIKIKFILFKQWTNFYFKRLYNKLIHTHIFH